MGSQETTTAWRAGELHALADLLANLTPGALAADHLDHLDQLGPREEDELAGAEVVGQGAERLGPDGHRGIQGPGLVQHRHRHQ